MLRKYFLDPLVSSNAPPWYDARGIAIGLFIGFSVPIGLQMIVLGLARALFPFNAVIAFAFTWVNNPLTVAPMYYGYYYLGSVILNKPPALSAADFKGLLDPILKTDFFWQTARQFAYLGWDFLLRWTVAALIVGVAVGCAGYWIGFYIQKEHCRRKAVALGMTYEKLLSDLNQGLNNRDSKRAGPG
jgi:uncharacterized protein (DUF2062 family)|uniref:DUF2062 domain-containing protein n=1 Tax=Desulfomonile tiedjei TaxID=2358 RepID=A0A7C4ASK1_9BACT